MLTAEHAIVTYDRQRAVPDRLGRATHAQYVALARSMVEIYRAGVGLTRRELHRRVRELLRDEHDCPPRRIAAFCKLLDDLSTYASPANAWRLRLDVFRAAAPRHVLVVQPDRLFEHGERHVKESIATSLGRSWMAIESDLYADVLERNRLVSFEGPEPAESLLSRYNVAQIQACMYRARRVSIVATRDLKVIIRHVKLLQLLHEIRRDAKTDEYTIELTGTASPLLATTRYGVQLAKLVPPLLACKGWRMRADLATPWGATAYFNLSDKDGFVGHILSPAEFDSTVEAKFANAFGAARDGWTLIHEGAVLAQNQKTFVPDFLFRHDDGCEVHLEVVGFWTPEYLAAKRETLRVFSAHRILLAVQAKLLHTSEPAAHVVAYKTVLKVPAVLAALEMMRGGTT
ncbi:MAG: DUF790 family protein [Phycisphaerae bacterium]|nr:DUF790 family protein [Phycisphaerae bacterium]